jgi:muramidase (phage lysozyme)
MARRIPNQDFVTWFDKRLHARWLLAVLDELTVHDPDALSTGHLHKLWAGAGEPPASPPPPPPPAAPQGLSARALAWLAVVRHAEGTLREDGYQTTFAYLRKIDTSKPHPGIVNRANGYASDASGAYQFLSKTWIDIHGGKNPPMTPENQDRAAVALMRRRGLDPNTAEFSPANVAKLAPEWASLPTLSGKSYYGQPVKSFAELERVFKARLVMSSPVAPPASPANQPAPAIVDTRILVTPAEQGLLGPKISAPLKSGDCYLLVNGRAGSVRAYDHTGGYLWVAPALCRGQGPGWRSHRGDTPPGLYRVGEVYRDYEQDPSPTFSGDRQSYGWYSLDLVDLEGQESSVGRSGIMIHGGGSAAGWPGAWAPRQPLHSTLGCIRMHNGDLRELVMPLLKSGKLYVGVYQP